MSERRVVWVDTASGSVRAQDPDIVSSTGAFRSVR